MNESEILRTSAYEMTVNISILFFFFARIFFFCFLSVSVVWTEWKFIIVVVANALHQREKLKLALHRKWQTEDVKRILTIFLWHGMCVASWSRAGQLETIAAVMVFSETTKTN